MYNVTVISTSKYITEIFKYKEKWRKYGFSITVLNDEIDLKSVKVPHVVIVPVSTSSLFVKTFVKRIRDKETGCRIVMYGRRTYERIKEAMDLSAFGYIPIPAQVSDIDSLILRLKNSLDKDKENLTDADSNENVENQVYNIIYGKYKADGDLKTAIECINPGFNYENTSFSLIELEFIDAIYYLEHIWRHEKELLYTAVENIVLKTNDLFNIFNINVTENKIYFLVFYENESNKDDYFNDVKNNIKEIIHLTTSINVLLDEDSASMLSFKTCEQIIKLSKLYRSDINDSNSVPEMERNTIRKSKKYIRENINNEISLNDVADFVGLSSAYFSRLFKQETGENFIDYLISVRMEKAKEYLGNSDYKTYEISKLVGYKKSKYFSKIFKNYTGYTPTEYRNLINNK